jgi:hypothetical protein
VIINVPDLTGAECGDVAITAAEGGIGYWSQIDTYKPDRWAGAFQQDGDNIEVDDSFVFYELMLDPQDNGTFTDGPYRVTPKVIRKGFELAIDKARADLVKRLLTIDRQDWTGEIDSEAADVIVQCGIFGEVRYG